MLQAKRSTIALYLMPTFIGILFINLFPILYTIYISFTNQSLYHYDDYQFVGFKNYWDALTNLTGDFYYVLGLTFLYVIICVTLFVVIGMATALALNNTKVRGLAFWRLLLILPWTVPSAITALIWLFLFGETFGPINQILRAVFGPTAGVDWLTTPVGAFTAVVLVNVWLSYPFFTIVILGALQSIPAELHESAQVDGATTWDRFRHVTLPLLRPAIAPAIILSSITTFQMFNTVKLITNGGPVTSALRPGTTSFVMIYIYDQLFGNTAGNPQYGSIGAVSVLIFILLFLMTLVGLRVTNLAKES